MEISYSNETENIEIKISGARLIIPIRKIALLQKLLKNENFNFSFNAKELSILFISSDKVKTIDELKNLSPSEVKDLENFIISLLGNERKVDAELMKRGFIDGPQLPFSLQASYLIT